MTCFDLLAMLCLMQSRLPFATFAGRAHCWLMFNLLFTRTLRSISVDGSAASWCISHSLQFYVISKLAKGTLCPIIQIINEDIEQDWTQY